MCGVIWLGLLWSNVHVIEPMPDVSSSCRLPVYVFSRKKKRIVCALYVIPCSLARKGSLYNIYL